MQTIINNKKELIRICPDNASVIEYSTNLGSFWITRFNGNHNIGLFKDLSSNGKAINATTNKGLFYSENEGRNWHSQENVKTIDAIELQQSFNIIDYKNFEWIDKLIYQSNFYDKILDIEKRHDTSTLRYILERIEHRIITLVSDDTYGYFLLDQRTKCEVIDLLSKRCFILNHLFAGVNEEIKILTDINNLLKNLTKKMHHRTCDLYRAMVKNCIDNDFEDSFIIRGSLTCDVDDDIFDFFGNVKPYEFDCYYGSDFNKMITIISHILIDYYHDNRLDSCIIEWNTQNKTDSTDEEFDCYEKDNNSLPENEMIYNINSKDIKLCKAARCLIFNFVFSIPDVLRLNKFDVKVQCENIHSVEQDGTRSSEKHDLFEDK